LIILF